MWILAIYKLIKYRLFIDIPGWKLEQTNLFVCSTSIPIIRCRSALQPTTCRRMHMCIAPILIDEYLFIFFNWGRIVGKNQNVAESTFIRVLHYLTVRMVGNKIFASLRAQKWRGGEYRVRKALVFFTRHYWRCPRHISLGSQKSCRWRHSDSCNKEHSCASDS